MGLYEIIADSKLLKGLGALFGVGATFAPTLEMLNPPAYADVILYEPRMAQETVTLLANLPEMSNFPKAGYDYKRKIAEAIIKVYANGIRSDPERACTGISILYDAAQETFGDELTAKAIQNPGLDQLLVMYNNCTGRTNPTESLTGKPGR